MKQQHKAAKPRYRETVLASTLSTCALHVFCTGPGFCHLQTPASANALHPLNVQSLLRQTAQRSRNWSSAQAGHDHDKEMGWKSYIKRGPHPLSAPICQPLAERNVVLVQISQTNVGTLLNWQISSNDSPCSMGLEARLQQASPFGSQKYMLQYGKSVDNAINVDF